MNQTPSKGRIVHFVLGGRYANNPGAARPAMITEAHENGDCALVVFTDAAPDGASPVVYVKSAKRADAAVDEEGTSRYPENTWHWPAYVPPPGVDKTGLVKRETKPAPPPTPEPLTFNAPTGPSQADEFLGQKHLKKSSHAKKDRPSEPPFKFGKDEK